MNKKEMFDAIFGGFVALFVVAIFLFVGFQGGRWYTRECAREEILRHKIGNYTTIHSLGVRIDAFGKVHNRGNAGTVYRFKVEKE